MHNALRALGIGIISASLFLAGCKKEESTTASASGGKKITVCLLPKKLGIPYFTSCNTGAQEAAKELGITVIYDGPADGAPEKSASMIEQWTLQGVDVIAVSPNEPKVLAEAMKNARAKGVKVITWDADGAPDTREWFVNQATSQEIGYALVDNLVKDLGADAEGEVAIITGYLAAANQREWIKYIEERMAKYPKLKLAETVPCDEDAKLAFQRAQDLMKTHSKLKGIFAITSVAFPASADAVHQAGNTGKILVTGLGTPSSMKEFVKNGTVKSVILWNTPDLGYLTIQTANAVANGTLKAGDTTLKAGRLGERKIAGDNVLLGNILVFTTENIDKYDF